MGTSRKAKKIKASKSKGKHVKNVGCRANNSNSLLESVSILIYPGDSSTLNLDSREFPFHFATINRTKKVPIITPKQIFKNYFASRR